MKSLHSEVITMGNLAWEILISGWCFNCPKNKIAFCIGGKVLTALEMEIRKHFSSYTKVMEFNNI